MRVNIDLVYMIREAKNKPCMDCKREYPYYVMQFDHVRGVKEANISSMCKQGYSQESVQEEIDKCDVVCANCHMERTWGAKSKHPFVHKHDPSCMHNYL